MDDRLPAEKNFFMSTMRGIYNVLFDKPATLFREKIATPFRGEPYPYYHRKYPRVPEIDECYSDDIACKVEADFQYRRDQEIDLEILRILQNRRDDCFFYEEHDHRDKCAPLVETFRQAELNYFIKYGDLGYTQTVIRAFMKQKHRMVWERRQREKAEREEKVVQTAQ